MVRGFAEITQQDWMRVFEVDHYVLTWRVYNNILPVRELEANCNYHYFKVSEVWLF